MSKWVPITVYIVSGCCKIQCYDKLWRPPGLTCAVEVEHQFKLHGLKSSDFILSFAEVGQPTGLLEPFDGALVVGELAGRAICISERDSNPGKLIAEVPDVPAEDVTDRALMRSRHQEQLRREYEDRTREVDAIHEECKDVALREVKARLKAEESALEAERLKDVDDDHVSHTGKRTYSTSKFYHEISECYSLISQQLAKELAELEEERGRAMRRKTDALADAASARAIFKL
jgi:hypothetical protein